MPLPAQLALEIVTPEGLLLREDVDEVVCPGEAGYFGVLPGHTPFMATLGAGELSYRVGSQWRYLTSFWGWCEVRPDRVNVLAEIGERAEDIDIGRADRARRHAEERLKDVKDEKGYAEAHLDYVRAVTRLAVARKERAGS